MMDCQEMLSYIMRIKGLCQYKISQTATALKLLKYFDRIDRIYSYFYALLAFVWVHVQHTQHGF
jgi:hypothetical protein